MGTPAQKNSVGHLLHNKIITNKNVLSCIFPNQLLSQSFLGPWLGATWNKCGLLKTGVQYLLKKHQLIWKAPDTRKPKMGAPKIWVFGKLWLSEGTSLVHFLSGVPLYWLSAQAMGGAGTNECLLKHKEKRRGDLKQDMSAVGWPITEMFTVQIFFGLFNFSP